MGIFSSLTPPGGLTIYPGPYNTIALLTNLRPNDRVPGPVPQNNEAYVPLQFDWTLLVGQISVTLPYNIGYFVNVGLAPNAIDKIACVVVDNSYCDYDIHIQFTDGFTLTVPAWEPMTVYPVITNVRAFSIWCDNPPQIFAPVGSPITSAIHCTTNVFVCNANIPPIKAPKLEKQVFKNVTAGAVGTYNFYTGTTAPGGGLCTQGVIQKLIIVNNSTYSGVSGIIGVTAVIDTVTFATFSFLSSSTTATASNQSQPVIIPGLNIRSSLIAFTIADFQVSALSVSITVVYIDRSLSSVLT